MALTHGKNTVFKLDDLAGSIADISAYFKSTGGLPGSADRPVVSQFGDMGERRPLLGLLDGGSIPLGGFFKPSTAIIHGKNTRVMFDQYSLASRVRKCSVKRSGKLDEVQQFGDTFKVRLPGVQDGSVSVDGFYNGAAGELHAIMRAARQQETPVLLAVGWNGFAIGQLVDLAQVGVTNYKITSDENSPVDSSVEMATDDRVELGVSLHDLTAETAPGNYTSVDETAATASGGVGHLQATAFTGTSCTVKIQHSTDNSAWVDLITFTNVTAATKERIEVSGTVNRYVRAIISAGTFSSCTFVVAFARRNYVYGTAGTYRHLAGGFARTFGAAAALDPVSLTFQYGPGGSASGAARLTGEAYFSSLEVTSDENNPIEFSAELMTTGTVTEDTF